MGGHEQKGRLSEAGEGKGFGRVTCAGGERCEV